MDDQVENKLKPNLLQRVEEVNQKYDHLMNHDQNHQEDNNQESYEAYNQNDDVEESHELEDGEISDEANHENHEVEDSDMQEEPNQWGTDQDYIDNIKKYVKTLKEDFCFTFQMVTELINEMEMTRRMDNFAGALESLITLYSKISIFHIKIKLETEKQW